ncbi:MAG: Holliday junction branch migration protein RuvA [Bacteroidetes bacterium]|nr:Holliday junction branch migration protein RuvA [Bacteroidota bacterium]
MIAHIEGKLTYKSPAYVVIDCGGVGYALQISLNTYDKIGNVEKCKLLTHLSIKEDGHTLYGFADEDERQLFLHLISVSGVGTNTARVILSSMKPNDVINAISSGNWSLLKSVKGIGPKTAQRLVIDLQDKLKNFATDATGLGFVTRSAAVEEALSAMLALGFGKNDAEKAILKLKQQNPDYTVELLVKNALKIL